MSDFTSAPFLFFFAAAVSCGMVCTWVFHTMRLEINAKVPDDRKIGALGGYPGLLSGVERIHREYYPRSALRVVLNVFIALGILCMVAVTKTLHMW